MAFDLNKGSGAKDRFNLSKEGQDVQTSKPVHQKQPTSSSNVPEKVTRKKAWPFLLALLAALGFCIWYFTKSPSNLAETTATTTSTQVDNSTNQLGTSSSPEASATSPIDGAVGQSSSEVPISRSQTPSASSTANNTATLENAIKETAKAESADPQIATQNSRGTSNSTKLMQPDFSFPSGSATVASLGKSWVNEVVAYAKSHPTENITINGYASSEGTLEYNNALSKRRANTVKRLLVARGISQSRLIAKGLGVESPIASNNDEIGRAKNRRIEVVVN